MGNAFNIRLPDVSLHAYGQRYCFAHGPDKERNRALRRAVADATIEIAGEGTPATSVRVIPLSDLRAIAAEYAAIAVPPAWGISPETLGQWTRHLSWKVQAIPTDAARVLVLGSSTCREAIYIRHRLPQADLTFVDHRDNRFPGIAEELRLRFIQGDFNDVLEGSAQPYDVIFSNHVLEHLYDPGKTLALACRALSENGVLVAAMPFDGLESTPFSDTLHRKDSLHPLDFCKVDIGHAWKADLPAVLRELRKAGFGEVALSQRDRYFAYADELYASQRAFYRRAALGRVLNRCLLAPPKELIKRLFPTEVPGVVLKTVFGVESRLWFGCNQLKNRFAPEYLVVTRPGR